jgi:hypothetical protein
MTQHSVAEARAGRCPAEPTGWPADGTAGRRVCGPAGLRVRPRRIAHTFRMTLNAMRNGGGGGQDPDAYWRRRVITLTIGLGLLGLLAWAFSGAGSGKVPHRATGQPQSMGGALPAAAYGSPSAGYSDAPSATGTAASSPAGASASPTSTTTPLLSPSAAPSGSPTATSTSPAKDSKSRAHASAARAPGRGGRCAAADVVVSLFVTKDSYPPGEMPQFDIDAVSTAPGKCTFDLGPRSLRLSVTSRGRVIWASDECVRGAGSKVTELTRGVPAEVSVTWDRVISASGCGPRHGTARPGGYSAVVSNGMEASQPSSFRLK